MHLSIQSGNVPKVADPMQIQTSFTDMVGKTLMPASCSSLAELTDLTPALDTAPAGEAACLHPTSLFMQCGK